MTCKSQVLCPINSATGHISSCMVCVCYYRLVSQLADVKTESSVGRFHFYDLLHDSCKHWCEELSILQYQYCYCCRTVDSTSAVLHKSSKTLVLLVHFHRSTGISIYSSSNSQYRHSCTLVLEVHQHFTLQTLQILLSLKLWDLGHSPMLKYITQEADYSCITTDYDSHKMAVNTFGRSHIEKLMSTDYHSGRITSTTCECCVCLSSATNCGMAVHSVTSLSLSVYLHVCLPACLPVCLYCLCSNCWKHFISKLNFSWCTVCQIQWWYAVITCCRIFSIFSIWRHSYFLR